VRAYSEAIYDFKTDKAKALTVYAIRLKQQDSKVLARPTITSRPNFLFRQGSSATVSAMRSSW
jgi:hypothetical protein